MKIAAIVVWYNPEAKFVANIKSYIDYVDRVIIIDNSASENIALVNESSKIEYIPLYKNEGIATALNIGLRRACELEMTWGLTMDQDSRFDERDIQNFLNPDAEHFKEPRVAIFAPSRKNKLSVEIVECDTVITSGSLTNLAIYAESSGFDDSMFIDEVDHEYCYQVKRAGYRVLTLNRIYMHHNLGSPVSKKILGKTITSANHGPARKYYMTRNRLYLRRLYPEFHIPFFTLFAKNFLRILLLESNKLTKIAHILKGIKHFKSGQMGKLRK